VRRDRGRPADQWHVQFSGGIVLATGKSPEKGDLMFVDPPALLLFALAKERGYLGAGFSPAGCSALIKRLIA
jgi:type IV secretory pathway protease TraF